MVTRTGKELLTRAGDELLIRTREVDTDWDERGAAD
jgi:hypothetical protein